MAGELKFSPELLFQSLKIRLVTTAGGRRLGLVTGRTETEAGAGGGQGKNLSSGPITSV